MLTLEAPKELNFIANHIAQGERVLIPFPDIDVVVIAKQDYIEFENYKEQAKKERATKRLENFKELQNKSKSNGTSGMSMEEIIADIKDYRSEQRGE
ncbi:MAG: hypothetical protein FWG87_05795 [Defluviitaleaceae bacterium]|nr:hypothetical protein [Defluviitaleaceae bacterium]